MGVASYYSEKSSLCTSKEDPELCKPSSFSLSFVRYSSRAWCDERNRETGVSFDGEIWMKIVAIDYRFQWRTRRTHSIGAHYFSCISTVLSANFLSVTISIIDSSGTHEVHALRNIFPFHWCVVFQCLLFFPANFLSCVSSIVIHWYKTNDSWLGSDMCRKPVTVFSLCLTLRPIWFVDIF